MVYLSGSRKKRVREMLVFLSKDYIIFAQSDESVENDTATYEYVDKLQVSTYNYVCMHACMRACACILVCVCTCICLCVRACVRACVYF